MLIYCVEDDSGVRELIMCVLKSGGYEAEEFELVADFNKALEKRLPDLVLLDIMLPDQDGISALEAMKHSSKYSDIPTIMLTAKSSEIDKVTALEAGADDYITKPFGVMELLSRIKAVLRRAGKKDNADTIAFGGITLDSNSRNVKYNGVEVPLTAKEFELLSCLMKNKNHVMTRDMLMDKVWGFEFEGISRTVDMHVTTLRKKLENAGCVNFIKTVRGIGYKTED